MLFAALHGRWKSVIFDHDFEAIARRDHVRPRVVSAVELLAKRLQRGCFEDMLQTNLKAGTSVRAWLGPLPCCSECHEPKCRAPASYLRGRGSAARLALHAVVVVSRTAPLNSFAAPVTVG